MADGSNRAPERWKTGNMPYTPGLTLEIAKKMLDAAEEEAKRQNVPMAMAIADCGANLIEFRRMDGVMLASTNIALDKAYTAVMGKQTSWHWTSMIESGGFAPLHVHQRFIPFPGGFPIKHRNAIYGGIGVSGGIIEDMYVAKAALEAGGYDVDEVNETLAKLDPSGD